MPIAHIRLIPALLLVAGVAAGTQAQHHSHPHVGELPAKPASFPALHSLEIERLTVEDGLPNDFVLDVVQDSVGFLWLATHEGLARYDGTSFEVYRHDPDDAGSLSFSRVETLHIDRSGTLWIGTYGGGLNRFDPVTDSFTHFRHDPDDPSTLSGDIVTQILEDRTGTFWVGTHSGLDRFDRESGTFTHFRHDPADTTSLSCDEVRVLYEDRRGTLWIGTGDAFLASPGTGAGGLNRFDRSTGTFIRFMHEPHEPTSLISNKVQALHEDASGTFWVGTMGGVLHKMDRASGTFERYVHDARGGRLVRPDHASLAPDCSVECGLIGFVEGDSAGTLWIGAWGHGLLRYDPVRDTLQLYGGDRSDSLSLSDAWTWNGEEMRDGTLWVGASNGLYRIAETAEPFSHFPHEETKTNSLSHGAVWGLQAENDGTLWIATFGGGLNRFDATTETFTHYRHDPDDASSLSSDSLTALYRDRSGVLWIGAEGGVLNRFDPETGRVTRYRHESKLPIASGFSLPLLKAEVTAILEDRNNQLWAGTWGEGLGYFDSRAGALRFYARESQDPGGLRLNIILALMEDRKGRLWVAASNGLYLFDREQEEFIHRLPAMTGAASALFEDRSGQIWVSNFSEGLWLFNPEQDEGIQFSSAQGLPAGNVRAIIEDDDGHIWVSTSFGSPLPDGRGRLARFDQDSRRFRTFGPSDNLPDVAFSHGSAAKDALGRLYFGGLGGFVAFDPKALEEPSGPRVVLTGLRLFGDRVRPGAEAPLEEPMYRAREITLSHEQHDFAIEYAGFDFGTGTPLRFQYMLEGHDADWVEAHGQRSAHYSRVRADKYLFRVRTARQGEGWSEESAALAVTVLPPWWRTWWAFGLYGLLFIGVIFSASRIQRKRIVRSERERAEREAETLRAEAAEARAHYLQLENERKTQELEAARALQLSMLPQKAPEHPAAEIAAYMQTATEVGGDYYDFHEDPKGALTVVIGDATGHGMQAGTMVAAVKSLFCEYDGESELAAVLRRWDGALQKMHLPKLYMALALVRLRGVTLELAGAGMPPALIHRADSGGIEEVPLKGLPLGSPGTFGYQTQRVSLKPGETVVLMSDGFPELVGGNGRMLGYSGAVDVVREVIDRSPEEIVAHLKKTVKAWRDGQPPRDDITLVVLRARDAV